MTWQNIADWDKQPGAEGCELPPPAPGWSFIPGKTTPLVPTGVPQTSGSSGGSPDATSAAAARAGAGVGGGAGGGGGGGGGAAVDDSDATCGLPAFSASESS